MKVIRKWVFKLGTAFYYFWGILKSQEIPLQRNYFQMLSGLLVLITETAETGHHRMSKIATIHPETGKEFEIVTIWAGAGINSSYYDRVAELKDENEKLKSEINELMESKDESD